MYVQTILWIINIQTPFGNTKYPELILSELKLNQIKAFSGLDNITEAGLSAINDRTDLVTSDQLALTNAEKKGIASEN